MDEPIARNEQIRELSLRSLHLATASLALVALVMAVSLFLGVGVVRSAQNDRNFTANIATELAIEVTCRSEIIARFRIAQAELIQAIADLAVDGDTPEILARITQTSDTLELLSAEQVASIEACAPTDG
jgi:phosphoglycerate-specific signal transduction histidine kinase